MTHQYIGARYVPKFFNINGSSAWLPNYYYEPLTIVTFNNSSYTSTQPVPANVGNPAENSEYWVNTGNYNGYLEELTKNFEKAIQGIRNKRRYILIGDSYMTAQNGAFPQTFKHALNLSDTDCYISAQGGSGWMTTTSFLDLIKRLTVEEPLSITDILILGGVNDGTRSYSELSSAMYNFNTYIKSIFPNARVSLGFISRTTTPGTMYAIYKEVLNAYEVCGTLGWGYIEGSTAWLRYDHIDADGLHPNENGANNLGWSLANYIMGLDNSASHYALKTFTVNLVDGITSNGPINLMTEWYGLIPHVYFSQAIITFSSSPTELTKLGTWNTTQIFNSVSETNGAIHTALLCVNNDEWVTLPVTFLIRLDGLYIHVYAPGNSPNITKLWLSPVESLLLPTTC